MNQYSIYIPSRGRADKNYTASNLIGNSMYFNLVVEPQDYQDYVDKFGQERVLRIPENNQGISYVRNWIKDYSTNLGEAFHWQIDDDIKVFRRRVDNKNVKTSPLDVLEEAEREVSKYSNIGAAGLTSNVFAFSAKYDIIPNRQVYSCMLINNALDIRYREHTIEDLDYSLQVLAEGWCTLFFTRVMFESVPTMKQKGGNTDIEYAGDRRQKLYLKIIADFPGWFQFKDKPNKLGVLTVKPSRIWRTFTQQPILKEQNES